MSMNYEAPVAEAVCFEAVNVITTSAGEEDTPDKMSTWGTGIAEFAFAERDLFS